MSKFDKYDRNSDFSYALGIFPSFEALENDLHNCIELIISNNANGDGVDRLVNSCKKNNINIMEAPRLLQKISAKKNTHVAMVVKKNFKKPLKTENHIVLHNIMDAGNLGTIIRSALGFNFNNIIIIKPATDIYDPQTIRASMGAIFKLNCIEYNSFDEYFREYSDRMFYPFMLKAQHSLSELTKNISKPYSLIFGNEGHGLSDEFLNIGKPCKILHSNKIDSLNLSVAAAIAMQRFSENYFDRGEQNEL